MTDPQKSAPARATVTPHTESAIQIERWFEAPRERVYALMTDPALIPEWWGPNGVTTEVDVMDFRPGGSWRFICHNSDGTETAFRGEYREINPPELTVQTFEWEGMPGFISVETARFEDHGERTKMVVIADYGTPEARDGTLASGMEGGMNETFVRFDELLAKQAA
jgi:uncharacterized protein YndB with AHSA1/START domain